MAFATAVTLTASDRLAVSVETRCTRGERPYRLARAQRQLGFLTLDDLGIGPLLQRLGIVAGAFNRFVPPDAVQCLRRARTDGMNLPRDRRP